MGKGVLWENKGCIKKMFFYKYFFLFHSSLNEELSGGNI